MNRKYLILFFSIIVLLNNITAQKTYFGFETGYGTYSMTQIKQILENSMNTNEIQPHRVSNFPGYLLFRPYLEIEYQYFNLGVAYTLLSTGSRYSIHDYSGEYKLNAQIVGNAVGMFAEIPISSFKNFKFLISAEGGIIFNKIKLNENIQLTDIYHQQDGYNLTSINIFVKPYLKLEYQIWKNISTNIVIGYHKDVIAKKMHLEDDNSRESDFNANWDGLRTSIGVSYLFE
ncbi:MAG: hypothetical protein PHV20_00200 [Bacteroidales bacterium]|nr:hypothetical protein [Bacteroidales bacterium]